MRIAIVVNTSWNIFNFRAGLIKALLDKGHEVVAVAPEDTYSERLTTMGCTFIPVKMEAKGVNPIKDMYLFSQLYKVYKTIRPDVILHYTIKPNIYGSLAARWLNIPVINNVSGLGTTFIRENGISRIARTMYKKAFRTPFKVFFQNRDDLKLFENKKLILKGKGEVIPGSGIDLSRFPVSDCAENKVFTFLLTGRMLYDKGVQEFVKAARMVKNNMPEVCIRFQLLGFIEDANKLGIPEKVINKWQEEGIVEYLGVTDNVYEFIKKADCVVLPSYREGLPKSLVEAAASGKPLITTNVPGCREVVKDGENGYLCKVKDAEHLAEKMTRMVRLAPEERRKMGSRSRQIAEEKFDQQVVIDRYLHHIEQVKQNQIV